ncbi:MAG TPA: alanine--glyoxylate aminotransferase family protein [Longimicrobiaceae bacterium]|nr:alanine--glyoxylate aminotransferase family protein [Longimicrobiaceae bacterium]
MQGRFFLPGPTEVRPEILAAMARQPVGHRGPELASLLADADPRLRRVFGTTRPVYISTSSATGLMEAAVRNGVRRRALALVNGAFSGRFRELVEAVGRECETYEVPWGEAHSPDIVEERLSAGGFDAVVVVHSETSTGVLNPIREIAAAARAAEGASGDDILVMVDGVSSVGGVQVEPDEWGLDWLLTGAQKALALPPGLAFGSPSERLLRRAATIDGRGRYFDLLELDSYWERHQTPATPAINLVYALAEQLRALDAEGMEARAARHIAMAELCWRWVDEVGSGFGMSILASPGFRSPTVTAIQLPPTVTGPELAASMSAHGYTISPGYGKLKDTTIRIGHMGDHTVGEVEELLSALQGVMIDG